MRTIKEILGDQYPDFMDYCIASEKSYPFDISLADYVAFRVQYRVSREYVNEIKDKINSGEVCKADAIVFDVPKTVESVETIDDVLSVDEQYEVSVIKKNAIGDDIEDIDEDESIQDESVNNVCVDNVDNEKIIYKENNKTIPYDIHVPLYVALEIINPERYSNIAIEAMGLKPRIERILKEGRRAFILDVLQSSIAQLFDFNNIARTAIANIIEQIKRFLSYDLNSLEIKLRQVTIPLCANETKTVEQFQNELFTSIVRYVSSSSYATVYAERRNMLRLMQLSALPTGFLSKLNALPEIDALKCLTDLTLVEKKAIFDLLKGLGYNRRRECYEILKYVYPDLYYYFVGNKTDNPANMIDRHKIYFEKYKWQKITNTLTEDFDDLVKQYAYEKGESIYSIQPRSLIVSELYDDDTAVLFVDGMGAEYVDYLSNLFADLQETEYAVSYNVGYCHLPTVTEINKDFLNGKKTLEPIYALDELKHSTFSYPLNITKEFDELKKIKELVLNAFNETTKKVIIASDHGTSRLAVLVRETKFDNKIKAEGLEIYRYGRYCIGTALEQQLPTAINYDGKLIFADYTRFEQKGAPSDEIHGGASIEEWLVPIVCVEKRSAKRKQEEKCEIETTTSIVEPEIGTGQVTIAFVVRGRKCKKINATIKGIRYACAEKDSEYFFNYIPAKNETEVKALILDGSILGEFVVKIKQKISQNKKFDI